MGSKSVSSCAHSSSLFPLFSLLPCCTFQITFFIDFADDSHCLLFLLHLHMHSSVVSPPPISLSSPCSSLFCPLVSSLYLLYLLFLTLLRMCVSICSVVVHPPTSPLLSLPPPLCPLLPLCLLLPTTSTLSTLCARAL